MKNNFFINIIVSIFLLFGLSSGSCYSIDVAQYYNDDFIEELVRSGKKDVVIVVSSWSGCGLQYPRSINISSRQARDLPHHLLYAQRLKERGINLKIYYLAFDNMQHFNHKDKRAIDNTVSKAYRDYLCGIKGIELSADQFEPIYLNPRFREKEGDLVEPDLPIVSTSKGPSLAFTGENAVNLRGLKHKISDHKKSGHIILGMTAHSGGRELDQLSSYLGVNMIGTSPAALKYGTKAGNKKLFARAGVPYVKGSDIAQTDVSLLLKDGVEVVKTTGAKTLIIKLNSSSAGKGNVDVDVSKCKTDKEIEDEMLKCMKENLHPDKDKDLKPGHDNFYLRKVKELGAIVEAKIDAGKACSPATFAVVKADGSIDVEYVYDQVLLGSAGQNFGGSIGPSELNEELQQRMIDYTRQICKTYAEAGGRGYIGIDFLKCERSDLVIIEANIRKTGTKYPYLMLKHLMSEHEIKSKTIFHDDNMKLPFKLSDITWRTEELNCFMDEFFRWLPSQSFHYNSRTKTGAIVTFETHTSGKIGVLSIGRDRDDVRDIRNQFDQAFKKFAHEIYPQHVVRRCVRGMDILRAGSLLPDSEALRAESLDLSRSRGLVAGPIVDRERRSSLLDLLIPRISGMWDRAKLKMISSGAKSDAVPTTVRDPIADIADLVKEARRHPFMRHEEVMAKRSKVRDLTFAIFGRTKTSDKLLIEAAKLGIQAYRMDENTDFTFDENQREGFVRGVAVPKLSERTGKWKVIADTTTQFNLPTVVYDYDFTSSRRMSYHARGDQIIVDKTSTVKEFLDKIGAAMLNTVLDDGVSHLSPTRSQLALYDAFKTTGSEICRYYPETLPLTSDLDMQIATLFRNNTYFFVKPVLAERRPDPVLGNIFVHRSEGAHEKEVIFEYACREKDGEGKYRSKLIFKKVKLAESELTANKFRSIIDRIKLEIGFAPDVQFLIQRAFRTPIISDFSARSISNKIRVITQHDPRTGEVLDTSVYGLYGGPNAHLAYVGDPMLHIDAAIRGGYRGYSRMDLYEAVKRTARQSHATLEVASGRRIGELVTDVLISLSGEIIPLKSKLKTERIDLDQVAQQTHFGSLLEGSKENRTAFIDKLTESESVRTKLLLEEIRRLHRDEFYPSEIQRKNMVSLFVPVIPGVPLPSGVLPVFK